MNTDDLILLLAQDRRLSAPSKTSFYLAVAAAAFTCALAVYFGLGLRSDILVVAQTFRFYLKFFVEFMVFASAFAVLRESVSPGFSMAGRRAFLLIPPTLVIAALLTELFTTQRASWYSQWLGHTALSCLTSVILMGAISLTLTLLSLRLAAPASPGKAGAFAGLLASAIAGFFYAVHCPEDSYLFVASWYGLSTAVLVVAGSFLGRLTLRW